MFESKKPDELAGYSSLIEAATNGLWREKTIPYVRQNISRIQYYVLTTFAQFAIVRISDDMRMKFANWTEGAVDIDQELRDEFADGCVTLNLSGTTPEEENQRLAEWISWTKEHFAPDRLRRPTLSTSANTSQITTQRDLEELSSKLAALASGATETGDIASGIFNSVRQSLPVNYAALDPSIRRDLHLFAMTQHPSRDLEAIQSIIESDPAKWLDEFVAASVHSLVSRLFVLKVIEDVYCRDENSPLLDPRYWVLNTDTYDTLSDEDTVGAVEQKLKSLSGSENSVVRGIGVFGAFYDWITLRVDPVLFRTLLELFVISDLKHLQGDLLGRFFENYAQRVNSTNRRALGQYYTPLPIVRYMWHLIDTTLSAIGVSTFTVLDPAMGSGTFLAEGASYLRRRSEENFWDRMVGFDISMQTMGIAQANIYMAILSQMTRNDALNVDELRLHTTDSLDPRNGQYLRQLMPLFDDQVHHEFLARSIQVSAEIKQSEQFNVIIGNPPYRNNSEITLAEAADRFPDLLGTSAAAASAQTRNIRDDYAWFFGAADRYADSQGLICYVTSDSYCSIQSYQWFRTELLRRYKIHRLVRLGRGVFQDVGPRISFAIIVLEKRAIPLENPEIAEPFVYVDLRAMATGTQNSELGTDDDPRFVHLREVVSGAVTAAEGVLHKPSSDRRYSLIPTHSDVTQRVLENSVPIAASRGAGDRVFSKKWPGIITAFDEFFRDDDKQTLQSRVSELFSVSAQYGSSFRQLVREIERWADRYRISNIDRAVRIGRWIADTGGAIVFEMERIKLTFAGSIPNSDRWIPPPKYRCFMYYEPRIRIPRNVNPGRNPGWGDMGQWRDPASHTISEKLVYTTSTNADYGHKAFVLDNSWYVKLHGARSQQYNYTGANDPTSPRDILGSEYNNLGSAGENIRLLIDGTSSGVIFYVAGIINSQLAQDFLADEPGVDLRIKQPSDHSVELAKQLAKASRRLMELHRLKYDRPSSELIESGHLESMMSPAMISELGFTLQAQDVDTRFRNDRAYVQPANVEEAIEQAIDDAQTYSDGLVEDIYS